MPNPVTNHVTRPRLALILLSLVVFLSALFVLTASSTSGTQGKSHTRSAASPSRPIERHQQVFLPGTGATSRRVAIIGAGASGSSAAWFLDRAAGVAAGRLGVEKRQVLSEVVIFEREGHAGGRTTTVHPHGDARLAAVELGGSIFVEANRHMNKAAKRFGLKLIDPDFGEAGLGIWDGTQFLLTTSTSQSRWSDWLDTARVIKRYGPLSPLRLKRAVATLVARFGNLYDPRWLAEHGPAQTIEDFAERVGLGREYTTRRGDEWAKTAVGASERWIGEIMEAGTRANYAADMNEIHALGAAVSSATGGAKSVEGGNWRIFEGMVYESRATQWFRSEVVDIVPQAGYDSPKFAVHTNDSSDNGLFDQIFYATPWYTGATEKGLPGLHGHLIEPVPHTRRHTRYARLHVTLLATSRLTVHPSFFGLPNDTTIPQTILTSGLTARTRKDTSPDADPYPAPPFQSISWHGETLPGSGEYIVKIFSKTLLSDNFLRSLLDEEPTWVLRKEWDAYPALSPLTTYPPVEPVKGVQYLAALEPWVSTMETQTLSAREAVARVVQRWWGLGYGECEGADGQQDTDAWDWSCE